MRAVVDLRRLGKLHVLDRREDSRKSRSGRGDEVGEVDRGDVFAGEAVLVREVHEEESVSARGSSASCGKCRKEPRTASPRW